MSEYRFTAEVARSSRVTIAAAELTALSERAYATPGGIVRVRSQWEPLASDVEIARIEVHVIDGDGQLAPRDVPSYVELFFHDAFLLLNIASPGSFGGAVTVSGGEYQVNDLVFDASPFACGAATVPLSAVVAWYRGGTEQLAEAPMQRVLFQLLHIGRGESDEWMLRARLADSLLALGISDPMADMPLLHPMHDEVLDDRVEDGATAVLDLAMVRVLTAIQDAVRAG